MKDELSTNTFREATDGVFQLMEHDSFRRFIASDDDDSIVQLKQKLTMSQSSMTYLKVPHSLPFLQEQKRPSNNDVTHCASTQMLSAMNSFELSAISVLHTVFGNTQQDNDKTCFSQSALSVSNQQAASGNNVDSDASDDDIESATIGLSTAIITPNLSSKSAVAKHGAGSSIQIATEAFVPKNEKKIARFLRKAARSLTGKPTQSRASSANIRPEYAWKKTNSNNNNTTKPRSNSTNSTCKVAQCSSPQTKRSASFQWQRSSVLTVQDIASEKCLPPKTANGKNKHNNNNNNNNQKVSKGMGLTKSISMPVSRITTSQDKNNNDSTRSTRRASDDIPLSMSVDGLIAFRHTVACMHSAHEHKDFPCMSTLLFPPTTARIRKSQCLSVPHSLHDSVWPY